MRRSARSQYNVMSPREVAELDVKSIVDPQWSVLALWIPSTLLPHGFDVMNAWGFTFKQVFVWTKTKKANLARKIDPSSTLNDELAFGMGRLFRQTHELALIGTCGKVYEHLKNKSQRSVILDENKGHSIKPEGLQDSLELMFPEGNKLEIFGRRVRQNWTTIGDGVTNEDVRVSIQNLIEL